MERITDILFAEIYTEDGEKLGHVFDLRCDGEPEHGFPNESRAITHILYGERSFWEVLGYKTLSLDSVPFSAVTKIEKGRVIVSNGAAPTKN
jgi:sporulation protein YlmC with PRC-barrel domain